MTLKRKFELKYMLLACQLSALNISNRFIGTTFLCRIYCSIFLDCHDFQFSGTSGKIETHLKMPPCNQENQSNNFVEAVHLLENQMTKILKYI